MSGERKLRHRTRWIIGVRLSDLPPTTTLVALTLAGWADENGRGARPSVSSIAHGCRLQRRVVFDHVSKLEQAGFIRRAHGRGVPNAYTLLIPAEIEAKIEAVLRRGQVVHGDAPPVGHGDALLDGEVGHGDALTTAWGRSGYGMGVHPSLTEPYKQSPHPEMEEDLNPNGKTEPAPEEELKGFWFKGEYHPYKAKPERSAS